MNNEPLDPQDAEWRARLSALGAGPAAPAGLEQRVTDALRARGVFRRMPLSKPHWSWAMASAAACALCFAAGLLLPRFIPAAGIHRETMPGTGRPQTKPAEQTTPRYLLLLIDAPSTPAPGSKEELALVREYSAWAAQERSAGRLIRGEKLNELSIEMSGRGGHEERKHDDRLGGFFLITAPNLGAAESIARTCPHLQHGGSIVVRPIDETP
jgi:hypothetical protein